MFETVPYPGNLKNIIRSAVAFSDLSRPYGYMLNLYQNVLNKEIPTDFRELKKQGFSVRDIEKITGISKSSVSRGIINE